MGKILSDEVILEKYVPMELYWDSYAYPFENV
jgi:hypothetical protein